MMVTVLSSALLAKDRVQRMKQRAKTKKPRHPVRSMAAKTVIVILLFRPVAMVTGGSTSVSQ